MQATLARELDLRANSLNLMRLILAGLVLVAHAWPLTGRGAGATLGGASLGAFAVAGFFAISGYLVSGSRLGTSVSRYAWLRLLRIFPAYWVSLLFTALVLAPVVSFVRSEHWTIGATFPYLFLNASTYQAHVHITGTLLSVQFAPGGLPPWNGSVWTLVYELTCYAWVGVLLSARRVRRHRALPLVLLFVSSYAAFVTPPVGWFILANAIQLSAPFAAGVALRLMSDRVPLTVPLLGVAATAAVVATSVGQMYAFGSLPIAYCLLWLGAKWRVPFGRRNDVSYGLYIYAFPVQQALADLGGDSWPLVVYLVATVVATVPLAAASWFLVERPCLRLRRWTPAVLRSRAAHPKADAGAGKAPAAEVLDDPVKRADSSVGAEDADPLPSRSASPLVT